MGTTPSNTRRKAFVAEINRWPGFVERSCMTSSDVSGIAAAFQKATESSKEDFLRRSDFEHWLEIEGNITPVQDRLFEVLRVGREGAQAQQISLHDFVVGLLNYCVDSKENLSRLAFDVYDRHTTGTITEADLEAMLIDVWGDKWDEDELAKRLLAERIGLDPMQPAEWEGFCRVYPNLLLPIFKLQRALQDLTIGKKRWIKMKERQKARNAKIEAKHILLLRSALTDEDRQKAEKTIQAEAAEASMLYGTRSERITAARQASGGGNRGLTPGAIKRGGGGQTASMKSAEVRQRRDASKRRSTALGIHPIYWDENPLNRPIVDGEEELPKFDITSRKIRGAHLPQDVGDWEGMSSRSVMTPGSNGSRRDPLGSRSSNSPRQAPSLPSIAAMEGDATSTTRDRRSSVGISKRLGGGLQTAGSTMGTSGGQSNGSSDPRRASRVVQLGSGDLATSLARQRSSAMVAAVGPHRKSSLAITTSTSMVCRPDVAMASTSTSGRNTRVAVGALKRTSVVAAREGKDADGLVSSYRRAKHQRVTPSRKPSRAVVAVGS